MQLSYWKEESKECLSNYQDYLSKKGDLECFMHSYKKEHDSSCDNSSFDGTLSLQESFSNNDSDDSFLNNSIDGDRDDDDDIFIFLSKLELTKKFNDIKKEKIICNKKQIIFIDITLDSNSSNTENTSCPSKKKENVSETPNKSNISKKRFLKILKKLKNLIDIKLNVKSYELQFDFGNFSLIRKNRKEFKDLEKKKTKIRNYLNYKYLMLRKFILLFQILAKNKISIKKYNDIYRSKIFLLKINEKLFNTSNSFYNVKIIHGNNNSFNDWKCKYLTSFFNLYKSMNYKTNMLNIKINYS